MVQGKRLSLVLVFFLLNRKVMNLSKFVVLSFFSVIFMGSVLAQDIERVDEAAFLKRVWNFKEFPHVFTYEGRRPAILFFAKDNSGECKAMHQIMDEVCRRHDGKFDVFKIENEAVLNELFGIKKYPTLIFVKKKKDPQSFEGFVQESKIESLIQSLFFGK